VPDNAPVKEEEMPTQQQLSTSVAATSTQEGTATTMDPVSDSTGDGMAGNAATGETTSTDVYTFVAEMPAYKDGEQGLFKYLSKHLRYPSEAIRAGVEGIVVVSFVVNSSGEISDATVVKSLGYGTDEEAMRVIQNMPRWTPGKQNGKPVAVRFTMPIRFSMKR
jgi:periplasmic protein TonB